MATESDAGRSDPEVTEWRLGGMARLLQLLLGSVVLVNAVVNLVLGHRGFLTVLDAVGGVLSLILIFYVVRVRVRANDSGVEIRVFRTRTIGYVDIAEVKLNRFTGYQSINLVRTDGSVVVPPAPRAAGAAVMTAAVEAIEYRRLMAQGEGR